MKKKKRFRRQQQQLQRWLHLRATSDKKKNIHTRNQPLVHLTPNRRGWLEEEYERRKKKRPFIINNMQKRHVCSYVHACISSANAPNDDRVNSFFLFFSALATPPVFCVSCSVDNNSWCWRWKTTYDCQSIADDDAIAATTTTTDTRLERRLQQSGRCYGFFFKINVCNMTSSQLSQTLTKWRPYFNSYNAGINKQIHIPFPEDEAVVVDSWHRVLRIHLYLFLRERVEKRHSNPYRFK